MSTITKLKAQFTVLTSLEANIQNAKNAAVYYGIKLEHKLTSIEGWEQLCDQIAIAQKFPLNFQATVKNKNQQNPIEDHTPTKDMTPMGNFPKIDKPDYVSVVDTDRKQHNKTVITCNIHKAKKDITQHLGKIGTEGEYSPLEYAEQLAESDKPKTIKNYLSLWETMENLAYKDNEGKLWRVSKLLTLNSFFDKDSVIDNILPLTYLVQPCRLAVSLLFYGGQPFKSDQMDRIHQIYLQKTSKNSKGELLPEIKDTFEVREFISNLQWRGSLSPIVVINDTTYRIDIKIAVTFTNKDPIPASFIPTDAKLPTRLKSSFIKGAKHDRYSSGKTETDPRISRYYQNVEVRLKLNDYRSDKTLCFVEYRFLDGSKNRNLWFSIGKIVLQKTKKNTSFLAFNDLKDRPYNKIADVIASGESQPWHDHLLIALTGLIGQTKIGAICFKADSNSQWLNPQWQREILRCQLEHLPSSYITIKDDRRCTKKHVEDQELLDPEISASLIIDWIGTQLFYPNKTNLIRGFALEKHSHKNKNYVTIVHPEKWETPDEINECFRFHERKLSVKEYLQLVEKATSYLKMMEERSFNSVQTLHDNQVIEVRNNEVTAKNSENAKRIILAYKKALPKPQPPLRDF